MKIEDLEKANDIQRRIKELKKVRGWLEDENKNVSLVGSGCSLIEAVDLSLKTRKLLLRTIIRENIGLQKEFEEL